ncbi:MAG TPA: hypothetical protein VHZ03_22165 [Trebonia sp.]|nr:hypothetical protein [Trebonia sp.]
MNESDRMATQTVANGDDLSGRLWAEGDFTADDGGSSVDPRSRLVSLGYLKTALKRQLKLLLILGLVGLVAGAAFYVIKPPSLQADTTILLNDGPNADAPAQIVTDAALAQSTAVGTAVIKQLGLNANLPVFLGSYVVTTPGDQVLVITLSAPTSAEAVQRVAAVAKQYLAVRAQYADVQQQQLESSLNNQVALAKAKLDSITNQVNQLAPQAFTATQKKQLATLRQQELTASNSLAQIQQNVTDTILTSRVATRQMIQDSRVINVATAVRASRARTLALYVVGGLLGGLVIGFAIICIGAISSNRLRRRDDVAYAIGSPVRLSVGPLRAGRVPILAGKPGNRDRDMKSVVQYLERSVPPSGQQGMASLAIVAVDDAPTVARVVISLALSKAKDGSRVLLADLSDGRQAAALMGVSQPGVQRASSRGTSIMVAVPAAGDVLPVGPLRTGRGGAATPGSPDDKSLAEASAAADVVLTLVTLDPASIGDNLGTWASRAIAVVTVGKSTPEWVHSIGEMVRLAGMHLDSVVLVGSDGTDESLGAVTEAYF